MIVVNIEIWPMGKEESKRQLAVIAIGNDGTGTEQRGNYSFGISHQAGTRYTKTLDPRALVRGIGAWRKGRVEHFPRRAGVVALVWATLVKSFGIHGPTEAEARGKDKL